MVHETIKIMLINGLLKNSRVLDNDSVYEKGEQSVLKKIKKNPNFEGVRGKWALHPTINYY